MFLTKCTYTMLLREIEWLIVRAVREMKEMDLVIKSCTRTNQSLELGDF